MADNTTIILGIFTFYIFIFAMLGLIGMGLSSTAIASPSPPSNILSFLSDIGYFFGGIAFSISNLGVFNIILFLPMGITLLYITLSFLRGSS